MMTGPGFASPLETVLTRLGESHELSVYCAIERLVQAADAVEINAETLVRLLDQGMTFAELLELIESKMKTPAKAA